MQPIKKEYGHFPFKTRLRLACSMLFDPQVLAVRVICADDMKRMTEEALQEFAKAQQAEAKAAEKVAKSVPITTADERANMVIQNQQQRTSRLQQEVMNIIFGLRPEHRERVQWFLTGLEAMSPVNAEVEQFIELISVLNGPDRAKLVVYASRLRPSVMRCPAGQAWGKANQEYVKDVIDQMGKWNEQTLQT
jgi:hypothetical protein